MWISKNMAEDKETAAAAVGIARGSTDARISSVTAGGKGRNALVMPAGMLSLPEMNEKEVNITTEEGTVCLGVEMGYYGGDIEPGEVLLFSSGEASVRLKRDGSRCIYCTGLYINDEEVSGIGSV